MAYSSFSFSFLNNFSKICLSVPAFSDWIIFWIIRFLSSGFNLFNFSDFFNNLAKSFSEILTGNSLKIKKNKNKYLKYIERVQINI